VLGHHVGPVARDVPVGAMPPGRAEAEGLGVIAQRDSYPGRGTGRGQAHGRSAGWARDMVADEPRIRAMGRVRHAEMPVQVGVAGCGLPVEVRRAQPPTLAKLQMTGHDAGLVVPGFLAPALALAGVLAAALAGGAAVASAESASGVAVA